MRAPSPESLTEHHPPQTQGNGPAGVTSRREAVSEVLDHIQVHYQSKDEDMPHATSTPARLPDNCAPWCEVRTLGIDPEEHDDRCISPDLASQRVHSTKGAKFDLYAMVARRPERMERDYVRLALDAAGGHEGVTLPLSTGAARSLAAGLTTAADVADGLRTFPGLAAAHPLHRAAHELDALAGTLPPDAAERVREQARALRMEGVTLG